jgi:hypothetical protein
MPVVTATFCKYTQKLALLLGARTSIHQIEINLEGLQPDLEIDSAVPSAVVDRVDKSGPETGGSPETVRDGDVPAIGRNVDEVGAIAREKSGSGSVAAP